jgi:hypothetical protein
MIMNTRLDAVSIATTIGSARQARRSTIVAPQRAFQLGPDRSFDPSPQYEQHRLRRQRQTSESWVDEDDEVMRGAHYSRTVEPKASFTGVRKFRLSGRNAVDGYRGSEHQSGTRRIRATA